MIRKEAKSRVEKIVGRELTRLQTLLKVNRGIKEIELELAAQRMAQLHAVIDSAHTRLDSLRLIRSQ